MQSIASHINHHNFLTHLTRASVSDPDRPHTPEQASCQVSSTDHVYGFLCQSDDYIYSAAAPFRLSSLYNSLSLRSCGWLPWIQLWRFTLSTRRKRSCCTSRPDPLEYPPCPSYPRTSSKAPIVFLVKNAWVLVCPEHRDRKSPCRKRDNCAGCHNRESRLGWAVRKKNIQRTSNTALISILIRGYRL